MAQKGLITKIIKTTTNSKLNWAQTTQVTLGLDPKGKSYDPKDWNYMSVVGMFKRPDITFAVNQVPRFTAAPKALHAKAIKSIVRYLMCDPNKDLTIKQDGMFDLKCWVEADFAGLYSR